MERIITKQTKMGEASVIIAGQQLRIVVAGSIKGTWHLANVVISPLSSPVTGANGAVNTQVLQRIFALTDAEADAVRTAVASARAAYAARPEAKIVGIPSERRALLDTLSAALDREAAHQERCYQCVTVDDIRRHWVARYGYLSRRRRPGASGHHRV